MSLEDKKERTEAEVGKRLVDRDGDEWVLRADGWCSQTVCRDHGRRHSCDEHDHRTLEQLQEWAPLVDATQETTHG